MHHFVVKFSKFSSPQAAGGIDPLTKIPADPPGRNHPVNLYYSPEEREKLRYLAAARRSSAKSPDYHIRGSEMDMGLVWLGWVGSGRVHAVGSVLASLAGVTF